MQEGDFPREFLIRRSQDLSQGWSACIKKSLELKRGDDIGIASKTIFRCVLCAIDLISRREYDCSNVNFIHDFDSIMVDRVGAAGVDTGKAF